MTKILKIKILNILYMLFFLVFIGEINATHIIGGDITYKYLGNDNYEITLTLRRDCRLSQVDFDPFASISIFRPENNTLITEIRVPFMASDTIGNTIESNCGFVGQPVCVQTTSYRTITRLIYRDNGYIIAYQRCCRNETIRNIDNPLQVGTTEWILLTPTALLANNSSPSFNLWPDVYICVDQPLSFDHSGFDLDGDSLVYKLSTPYEGATLNNPRPQPSFPPPFRPVEFKSPYSLNNLMGGTPLVVNPETGRITALPNDVGQYLVGIRIEEYRNGQLLSIVRRNFQYNVVICSEAITGDFEYENNICDSLEVNFTNNLKGASSFEWNFNFPSSDPSFISAENNPTFKYPNPGNYIVRLLARSSNGACDTIITKEIRAAEMNNIKDLNFIDSTFTLCFGDTLSIVKDTSIGYDYNFDPLVGIDLTDAKNPKLIGTASQTYTVTVTNDDGCEFVGQISSNIYPLPTPLIIEGPENVCQNDIELIATGGYGTFEWSLDSLFNTVITNLDTLRFSLTETSQNLYVRSVSPNGCGELSAFLNIRNQVPNLYFENPSYICKGGEGIVVFENLIENHIVTYDFNDPHIIAISNDTMFVTSLPEDMDSIIISGQIFNQFGCSIDIEIRLLLVEVNDVDFFAALNSCEDYTMCFEINGVYTGQVSWTFGSGLSIDTSDMTRPCFTYENDGMYEVTLSNQNSNCPFVPKTKTIEVPQLGDTKVAIISNLINCDDGTFCFEVSGNYIGGITWNFGDATYPDSTSNEINPCYTYLIPGTYTVTLSNDNEICPFDTITKLIVVPKWEDINVDILATIENCEEGIVCFEVSGNYIGGITWNFGDATYPDSTSNEINPCYTYPISGTYTITLTNDNEICPFDTITKLIEVPKWEDRNVGILATVTNCEEGIICFEVSGSYEGGITWNFGDATYPDSTSNEATPCYNYPNPGIYTVTLTNDNEICPFDAKTIEITVPEKLKLIVLPNIIICQGQEIELSVEANIMGTTFVWVSANGDTLGTTSTLNYVATDSNTLTIFGESPDGCKDDVQTTIDIMNLMLSVITRPQVICIGEEFMAEVTVDNPDEYTFDWMPKDCIISGVGTKMAFFIALADKVYSVIVIEKSTGCEQLIEFTANLTEPILANFEGTVCAGQESHVQVFIENPENYDFEWSPANLIVSGGNTPIPTVNMNDGQILTVVITNKDTGCSREFTYSPNVLLPLIINFTDPNLDISQGLSTSITIRNPQGGTSYVWSTGDIGTSIDIAPLNTTTYTVTATDVNGCTGVAQITVNVRTVPCTESDEYLPNAFTPNGDNFNDILFVKSNVITEMTLVIFNRWGQEVFRTTDINTGWDGTFQGKDCTPDAYAYYLQASCINGDTFAKKGNVSLIR